MVLVLFTVMKVAVCFIHMPLKELCIVSTIVLQDIVTNNLRLTMTYREINKRLLEQFQHQTTSLGPIVHDVRNVMHAQILLVVHTVGTCVVYCQHSSVFLM